jgi:2-phospho-L-lactate guanylyltransferase
VATPDPEAGAAARALGAEARVADDPGLNAALDAAARELAGPGDALLVVLGDVAGAAGRDLAALFAALAELGGRGAVLAPARDGGTAALLRRPPDAIPSCFGADSAKAHRSAAERAGVPFRELALPSLAIDLDRADDLGALLASEAAAPRTRALLATLRAAR